MKVSTLYNISSFNFRYMTILYFLNDVQEGGETAFPLAGNKSVNLKVITNLEYFFCTFYTFCFGVLAKPQLSLAVFFSIVQDALESKDA